MVRPIPGEYCLNEGINVPLPGGARDDQRTLSAADEPAMHPEILIASRPDLANRLAEDFAHEAERRRRSGGMFSVALPGGSLAAAFFPRLARLELDWSRVEFFSVDERSVPPSSPESNFGIAERLWFGPAEVPAAHTHRMLADAPDVLSATEAYAEELGRATGVPPQLDYVLLGVGPDGHVASLFPEHPLLEEQDRAVAYLSDAPKPPAGRMTLTLPPLSSARRVAIGALGAEKAEVIARAVLDVGSMLPVAQVIRRAARVLLLLDPEAAVRIA
jgi:6-phosphogluconolactonase